MKSIYGSGELTNNLIDWIVVVILNETEASLLATLLVSDDNYRSNLAESLEVVAQILLLKVIVETADEKFFHRRSSFWSTDVVPGHCAFWFDGSV